MLAPTLTTTGTLVPRGPGGGLGARADVAEEVADAGCADGQRVVAVGGSEGREAADRVGRRRILRDRHGRVDQVGPAVECETQIRRREGGRVDRFRERDVNRIHRAALRAGDRRERSDGGRCGRRGLVVNEVRAGAVVVEDVQLVIDRRSTRRRDRAIGRPGLVAYRDDGAVRADDLVEGVSCARVGDLNVVPAARDVGGDLEGQLAARTDWAGDGIRRIINRGSRPVREVDRIGQAVRVGDIVDQVIRGAGTVWIVEIAGMDQGVRLHAANQARLRAAQSIGVAERGGEVVEHSLERRQEQEARVGRLSGGDIAEVDRQRRRLRLVADLGSDDLEGIEQALLVLDDLRLGRGD